MLIYNYDMANYSSRRQAVLEVIHNLRCHPSADRIYEECRKTIPNISLGTVYRNLMYLEQQGKLGRVIGCDGKEHYDVEMDTHCHIICPVCGQITDMDYPEDVKNVLDGFCEKNEMQKFGLIFYKNCDKCKSNVENQVID